MLDDIRPRLLSTVTVRDRSDGTEGIYDPDTGHSFETAKDQSKLAIMFDGERSLLDISAAHLNESSFVPFAALNDLMRALVRANLLENPPDDLVDQVDWTEMLSPRPLVRFRTLVPTVLRATEVLLWVLFAAASLREIPAPLSAIDVGLAYVGASLALTLRGRFKGAVCALLGASPPRGSISMVLGVLYLTPDPGVVVLLQRGQRVLASLAALAGSICAMAIGAAHPGLWAGAAVVLLIDLCPFITSSAGAVLAALVGRVDLREHVRSYLGRPLIKNLLAFKLPRADRDLFFTALLSIGWLIAAIAITVPMGINTGRALIEVGSATPGFAGIAAYLGAVALFTLFPLLLMMLLGRVVEASFSVLWSEQSGKQAAAEVDAAIFRSIPLFSRLAQDDLQAMASASREVVYGADQTIVQQGNQGDRFYAIRSGVVLVEREGTDHRTRGVARLGMGDCFGEIALLHDGVRTATVKTITETVVIEMSKEAFEKVRASVEGLDFVAVLRAATAIGKSRLFGQLPDERRRSLSMKFVPRSVPAGTDVVRFGEKGDEFYLVGKGELEVISGAGVKVGQLAAGDHFGEIALLRNMPRTATVRTVTDTVVLVLSRTFFTQALSSDLELLRTVEEIAETRLTHATSS